MRVTANQVMHFTVPLLFAAPDSVAAMAAVFITSAACLASGRATSASAATRGIEVRPAAL
jgi:hypothetical protein